jgi:hypothetical protein
MKDAIASQQRDVSRVVTPEIQQHMKPGICFLLLYVMFV